MTKTFNFQNSFQIILQAPAKLNLALDILGKDEASGYHYMQSVMQEIPWLCDEIEVSLKGSTHEPGSGITELELLNDGEKVIDSGRGQNELRNIISSDRSNTVWQAVELMRRETKRMDDVYIKLFKNIPSQSGLGGGSSDAAQILKFLNKYWELGKTRRQLAELGSEIGMDVCFFIWGGTCLVSKYGQDVQKLNDLNLTEDDLQINLNCRQMPTAEAYQSLDLSKCGQRIADTKLLVEGIQAGQSFQDLKQYFHNDFEESFLRKYPSGIRINPESESKIIMLCGSGGASFRF